MIPSAKRGVQLYFARESGVAVREQSASSRYGVVNVSKVPHRSPFRYPGGKTWLVPHVRAWLQSLPARPIEFVEPFAGGAIVGLSVLFDGLCDRLTLVEKDEDVAAVWKVVLNGKAMALADDLCRFVVTEPNVRAVLDTRQRSL